MAFYNPDKQIVIGRNQAIDSWVIVNSNGSNSQIGFNSKVKAAVVAKEVSKLHPNKQLGILSDSIGQACKLFYGEVIWFKEGTQF